jgi:fatty acid desaturase
MSQDQQSASAWVPPGAADISLDRKVLKSLMRRSDGIPLLRLAVCVSLLCALGALYAASFGTWWFIPTLIMFGGATSLCVYSLSHECAHGTVFRSRWLNETVFWLASLVYGQEVLYRRYSHASHHTYTMYVGKDGQLPFPQPAHLASYLLWYTGAMYYIHFMKILVLHSLGRFNERTLAFTPVEELPRIVRNSRAFLAIYALAIVLSVYFESTVLVWFWLLPKLAGDPIAALYAGSQHF